MEITTQENPTGTNLLFNSLVWVMSNLLAWVSIEVRNLSFGSIAELTFLWTFRGLSMLSLVLIIAINWKGGKAQIRAWFTKK